MLTCANLVFNLHLYPNSRPNCLVCSFRLVSSFLYVFLLPNLCLLIHGVWLMDVDLQWFADWSLRRVRVYTSLTVIPGKSKAHTNSLEPFSCTFLMYLMNVWFSCLTFSGTSSCILSENSMRLDCKGTVHLKFALIILHRLLPDPWIGTSINKCNKSKCGEIDNVHDDVTSDWFEPEVFKWWCVQEQSIPVELNSGKLVVTFCIIFFLLL